MFVVIVSLGLGCAEQSSPNVERAKQHMAMLDYQAASLELKTALGSDRSLVEARWLLGQIYLELGDVRSAEKELLLAAEFGWVGDDTRPALAKAYLSQGKFHQALQLNPEGLQPDAAARLLSIQALAELAQGRTEAAARLVAAARKYRPDSGAAALAEARIYAYQWRTRAALALVDAVLADNAFNADAWRLRGQLLLQSEKLEDARNAYDRAIAYSNVAFSDRVSRALINYQLEEFGAVSAESAILLQLSPQHPSAQYIHGLVLFREGNYREASKAFTKAEP
ncbi:MAG: tetratricopeptide repeat protein, partial [Halioglobus sp.]|nr:tetratricopeptide repeat protein [Halioglobus sp.]